MTSPDSSVASPQLELFVSIGLSEQRAKETLKNKQLTEKLESIVHTATKLASDSTIGKERPLVTGCITSY